MGTSLRKLIQAIMCLLIMVVTFEVLLQSSFTSSLQSRKVENNDALMADIEDNSTDIKQDLEIALLKIEKDQFTYPNEKYKVIGNVSPAYRMSGSQGNHGIVICTQTSLGNLHHVLELSRKWDGHVSVAVFSTGEQIPLAIYYILLMRKCSEHVHSNVSFHFVFPNAKQLSGLSAVYKMNYTCDDLPGFRKMFPGENYAMNLSYPVNVLRNVALMFSTSEFVLNLDIDFIPSKGMKQDMESFLQRKSTRHQNMAYILPAFESNVTFKESLSKSELLNEIKKGTVRQFTMKKCYNCHVLTNYTRWKQLPYPSQMNASYFINYHMPFEPFFIAERERLPMFDERFKSYGFNRVSQICEAYYSGIDFAVMNNAFVMHAGFKDPKKFYKWKSQSNTRNMYIFNTVFKQDLKRKYPNSKRTY